MSVSNSPAPIIETKGISKSFPGVEALRKVDFSISPGEVVALLGENGAGKSTFIKILAGAHQPSQGQILANGTPVRFESPRHSREAGIAVMHQELNLIPGLSIRENLFLGQETTKRWGLLDHPSEKSAARKLLRRIGLASHPDTLCGNLTVAQQQMVEIARALSRDAKLVIMDEPTAALSPAESESLFEAVGELRDRGIAVVYISHRLDEIERLCDRVVILRDGEVVDRGKIGELSREQWIEKMAGRPLESEFPNRKAEIGDEKLRVESLQLGNRIRDVSFRVCSGEVLGFAGLAGAGRTDVMRALAGAEPLASGKIFIAGEKASIHSPRGAIEKGICLLTEDRKKEGLVLNRPVVENFGLPSLKRYSKRGRHNHRAERGELENYRRELKIRMTGHRQRTEHLSGGNQQKVVLAKWLAVDSEIIIMDEPTRGIDVGAKYEIYEWINRLAARGKAIILVSSELPELIGMCDRIVVMHGGEIRGEVAGMNDVSQEVLLKLAMGEAGE